MSALAPTVRIGGAIIGIALIHAAFVTDRPLLGFLGITAAAGAALAGNWRVWLKSGRLAGVGVAVLLLGLVAVFATPAVQGYLLIAIPIAVHLGLAVLFGQSLLPGRTALITCFSRVERAPVIDPVIERYTRGVTWIWVVYFLSIAAGAIFLATIGRLAAASWVTSILSPGIGILLFGGEHAHRYLRPGIFGPTSFVRTFRSMANPEAWRLAKSRG